MSFEKPAVVIDNGSYTTKCGFSSDNHPVSMFRTVVGRPSYLEGNYGKEHYEVLVGDCALDVEDYDLNSPICGERIVHWDNMERIWHHCFYRELKVAPEDRAVLLCCAHNTSVQDKVHCCEIFFETLNTPSLCMQTHPSLAIYSQGLTSGICVDMAYDKVNINPVFEGGLIHYAHMSTNLAVSQILAYLKECLNERGYEYGVHVDDDLLEEIRRNCVYVTPDIAMQKCNYNVPYQLLNGTEINICNEAFMSGELIFNPQDVKGKETSFWPLHEAIKTSLKKCDTDLYNDLLSGIVLCGGLSMIPLLAERLRDELEKLLQLPVTVLRSDEAYAASWLGGAMFAELPDATKVWVTKEQFLEHGERVVRNKFLS